VVQIHQGIKLLGKRRRAMKFQITNFDSIQDLLDKIGEEGQDDGEREEDLSFLLGKGVYFSEKAPAIFGNGRKEDASIEFDTENDFIAMPYECECAFVWKGEKPEKIEFASRAYKPGLALSAFVNKIGYITTCFEDD
jgi:hypothetical protein